LHYVVSRVAQDGSHLLDALLMAAEFLGKTGLNEIDFEDFAAASAAAERCAEAAGGAKYLNFYRMLLGADP
jgi:hypothetical protein